MKKGTSKLTPHLEEIKELLLSGMSIAKITVHLDGHFEDALSYDTVYSFIENNRLHSLDYRGSSLAVPVCNNCEDCTEFLNFDGDGAVRHCIRARQMISSQCRTSPVWCHKRAVKKWNRTEGLADEIYKMQKKA